MQLSVCNCLQLCSIFIQYMESHKHKSQSASVKLSKRLLHVRYQKNLIHNPLETDHLQSRCIKQILSMQFLQPDHVPKRRIQKYLFLLIQRVTHQEQQREHSNFNTISFLPYFTFTSHHHLYIQKTNTNPLTCFYSDYTSYNYNLGCITLRSLYESQ